MKKLKSILTATALAVACMELLGCGRGHAARTLENGWYERADSLANGPMVNERNRRLGETGVRCMCEGTFIVKDISTNTFEVISAPKGYSDTVGRVFKGKKLPSFGNYMD